MSWIGLLNRRKNEIDSGALLVENPFHALKNDSSPGAG
jgi:hypothetical protein